MKIVKKQESQVLKESGSTQKNEQELLKESLTSIKKGRANPLTEDKGLWLFALCRIGQGIAVDDVLFEYCLDAATDRVLGFLLVHSSVVIIEDAEETGAAVLHIILHDVYAIDTPYRNDRVCFKLSLGFFVTRFYYGKFAFEDRCEEVAIATCWFEEA
jgi:hypothetical protein